VSRIPAEHELTELYRSAAQWAEFRAAVPPSVESGPDRAAVRRSWLPLWVAAATAAIAIGAVGVPRYLDQQRSDSVELATRVGSIAKAPPRRDSTSGQPTVKATSSPVPVRPTPAPTTTLQEVGTTELSQVTVFPWVSGTGCGRLVATKIWIEPQSPVNGVLRRLTKTSPGGSPGVFVSSLSGFRITANRQLKQLVVNIESTAPMNMPVGCRSLAVDSMLRQSLKQFVGPQARLSLRLHNSEDSYRRYLLGQAS
jgi:hypothetical protein